MGNRRKVKKTIRKEDNVAGLLQCSDAPYCHAENSKRRSIAGFLVDVLFKPCCGGSSARRSRGPAIKGDQPDTPPTTQATCSLSSSPSSPEPGPSMDNVISLQQPNTHDSEIERKPVSGNFLNDLKAASSNNTDNDNVHVIDLEDVLEQSRGEEQDSTEQKSIIDNEHSTQSTSSAIPGIPGDISILSSNKRKLPPMKPASLTRAMTNMQRALEKVEEEEEENIPSIMSIKVLKQNAFEHKKQKSEQDQLPTELMDCTAVYDRQGMKAKLVEKKKAIKTEEKKISQLKKREKLDQEIGKVWKKIPKRTRKQIISENDAAIERHNEAIQTLKRKIELLKEKQAYKLMKYNLLRSEGYNSILAEAVWQCKVMKIRLRYFSLGREVDELWTKVYSLQNKVRKLTPNSCNPSNGSKNDEQVFDEVNGDAHAQAGPSDTCGKPNVDEPTEQDPFVRYGVARKPASSALMAIFIGESSRKLSASKQTCREVDSDSDKKVGEDDLAKNNSKGDENIETGSTYSSDFEDDPDDIESSDPPLYHTTRSDPPHKDLPEHLYTIREETEEDLKDYENDVYLSSDSNQNEDFEPIGTETDSYV